MKEGNYNGMSGLLLGYVNHSLHDTYQNWSKTDLIFFMSPQSIVIDLAGLSAYKTFGMLTWFLIAS